MTLTNIRWLGHSSFLIEAKEGGIIYIDPYETKSDIMADYIFITHSHYDHLSIKDILRISNGETVIFAPLDAKPKLKDFSGKTVYVEPNNIYQHEDIVVYTKPAYNIESSFHPMSNNWVGYIIEIDSKRYYHAGDTDLLDELKDIEDIFVAMLPVGGTYTMDAEKAAELANTIRPRYAIPMHYGTVVGDKKDAERFKELFNGETIIMSKE
ncbi:MAG: MBL fold metallo-hydrolase [Candidatus Woesearchaeota archaeon]